MKNVGTAPATITAQTRESAAARSGTLGDLIKEKLGDKLDETLKR